MLYPIELLRHEVAREDRGTMDGEHVNGQACFCHVVLRLFKCRQTPHAPRHRSPCKLHHLKTPSLQIALMPFFAEVLVHCF